MTAGTAARANVSKPASEHVVHAFAGKKRGEARGGHVPGAVKRPV